MNLPYGLWLRDGEQVVVALLYARQVCKLLPTEVLFAEAEGLYHGAHGTIEQKHPSLGQAVGN